MFYLFRLLRNNLFPITFIVLFGISVLQVVQFNLYQESFYFNTSNVVLNSAARMQSSVTTYFGLKEVNKALAEENLRLKNGAKTNLVVVDTSHQTLKDSNGVKRYSYIVCGVIKSGTTRRNNFITIDKGSLSGVKKGMAVISPSGIAGFVFDVTDNFALVLSVLSSQFTATPMLPELNIREGSVTWDGGDPQLAQLNNINKFEKIKVGMQVVTSNYSVKFPPGIPIGTISKVEKKSTSSFYDIDLKLATDFTKLQYLYVVTDHFQPQLDTLNTRENTNVPR